MIETRKVDIKFADPRWHARLAPDYDIVYEWSDLSDLIAAPQRAYRGDDLAFIVDSSTINGHDEAKAKFIEVQEKCTALSLSSNAEVQGDVCDAPRKIQIEYMDGFWVAEILLDFDQPYVYRRLVHLTNSAQRALPDKPLLFVVDQATIAGYVDAETQLLEAGEKSGAMVISSVQEF